MKVFFKYIARAILVLLCILILIPILLYIPPIQTWSKNKLVSILSEKTGWTVGLDHFRLGFPLNLSIKDFVAINQQNDTLFHLGQFKTSIEFLPLLKGNVSVRSLSLLDGSSNMIGIIDGMDLTGKVGSFEIKDIQLNLQQQNVKVNQINLFDSQVDMKLFQTTDTTTKQSNPLNWNIAIGQLKIQNSGYSLAMDRNQLYINTQIGKVLMQNGEISLLDNSYQVKNLRLTDSYYKMDLDTLSPKKGFDPSHLYIQQLDFSAKNIYYKGSIVKADIDQGSFMEQSGLELKQLSGLFEMDSTYLQGEKFILETANSQVHFDALIDMTIFDSIPQGKLFTQLEATLGWKDMLLLGSHYVSDLETFLPKENLKFHLDTKGDMSQLTVSKSFIKWPSHLDVNFDGQLKNINKPKLANGKLELDASFEDLSFVPFIMPDTTFRHLVSIPKNIKIEGNMLVKKGDYKTSLEMSQDYSTLLLDASFNSSSETYSVNLNTDSLNIRKFLPSTKIDVLTMNFSGQGEGFDLLNKKTLLQLDGEVSNLKIDKYQLKTIKLNSVLKNSLYTFTLTSNDQPLKLDIDLSGILSKKEISTKLLANIERLDLYELNLSDQDLVFGANVSATAKTDLKNIYFIDSHIDDIRLIDKGVLNRLGDLYLLADMNQDSVRASIKNGDLVMKFDATTSLDSLLNQISLFSKRMFSQIEQKNFDLKSLQEVLPEMMLQLSAGTQNALYGYVKASGFRYENANLLLWNDVEDGLRFDSYVKNLKKDTITLNTVNIDFSQDKRDLNYELTAESINQDPNKAFDVKALGKLSQNDLSLDAIQKNGLGKVGLDLGLNLHYDSTSIKLHIDPKGPVLFYRNWTINPNNYIALINQKIVLADFLLTGDRGMQISIQSQDSLQKDDKNVVKVGVNKFEISQISSILPNIPSFSGMLEGMFDLTLEKDQMDAKGVVNLDNFIYNKQGLGDLLFDVNYESAKDIGQYAYAALTWDKNKIIETDFSLSPGDSSGINSNLYMYDVPLKLADPFIPEAVATMKGKATGEIGLTGSFDKPDINGSVTFDSAMLTVSYAKATYKLDSVPLVFDKSVLNFNKFKIWGYNNNPLLVNGVINMQNIDRMTANLKITGENVELLNVKKQSDQMVYGKMLMNLNTNISGPLTFLKVNGNVNLLAGTNVNYVMLDSPVSAQNRVANLVTFTSFNDSIDSDYHINNKPTTLTGIDLLIKVNIAQSVMLGIDLSTNGDDRVELRGGGELAYKMNPMGDTDLSGRYNLTGGFVRYNLPILPVGKTFNIQNGSYVEWSGKMLDPYIYIIALEKIRANVSEEGKGSRMVTFEPMIIIKNRLDDLSITFDVETPDDANIQNQLSQMTAEERSKQSMNLIITQTYTGPGTTTKMNTNSALNAFIQKEINQFAGSALKGVDLSFGIDTYDQDGSDGQSSKRTDYSFRFSKQFFNDRFRVVVGGKVSSGQENSLDQNQSFIDDVALEYNLDKSGTRYLKLFHHTGFESVLEGDIVETGIGIVLKRKIRKLRQLFIFNDERRRKAIYAEPNTENN